jgi:hypothetical protein
LTTLKKYAILNILGVLALMILIWGMSVKYKKVLIAKEKGG